MKTPSETEILEELEEDMTEEYSMRIESSANSLASGIAAATTYLAGGGRGYVTEAFRIGKLIGVNTRIVDDILDGEKIEQIEDREKFLNNYIKSLKGRKVDPVENESEKVAYRAGRILGEHLDQEVMTSYMKDVRDILKDEEKSSREGYKSYSRGVSATIGETVGMGLDELEDFSATTENLGFAYDFAYLGQVADDKMDADTGIEEDIDEFYNEAIERINKHGLKGNIIGTFAGAYPQVYNTMRKVRSEKL